MLDNIFLDDKNSLSQNEEIVLYRKSAIVIPRKYEKYSFYENIKNFLIRYVRNYGGSQDEYSIYTFFYEFKNCLLIPRYFPLENFIFEEFKLIDDTNNKEYKSIEINSNIKLKDEIQKETTNYMLNNENGIIKLSPGSGKTIISIYMICKKKLKTIILCHRRNLIQQWKERFLEFTDIEEDNINIFDNNKNNNFDKYITLVTDQTLINSIRKDQNNIIEKLKKSNNGIFIADEVHTSVGAPVFSECSCYIPSKFTFGLSATPLRNDGTSDVIQFHLGNIYEPDINTGQNSERFSQADVIFLLFDFQIINERSRKYVYWAGNFSRARYLNYFRKCNILNKISISILNKFIKDNRNIIFVSERKNHIIFLFDQLQFSDKSKFIESTTIEELDHKVTFATPGKIRDGIDAPQKDALILTSPIGNIEQMSGRIERTFPGKDNITIVDMVDIGCYNIAITSYKRLKYYSQKKWNIKYIYIDSSNGNKKEIDYNEFKELLKKR